VADVEGNATTRRSWRGCALGEGAETDRQLAGFDLNDFVTRSGSLRVFGEDLLNVENVGWFAFDGARWSGEVAATRRLYARIERLHRSERNRGL